MTCSSRVATWWLCGKVSKINSGIEDQECFSIAMLWIKGHKYAFFSCYWWLSLETVFLGCTWRHHSKTKESRSRNHEIAQSGINILWDKDSLLLGERRDRGRESSARNYCAFIAGEQKRARRLILTSLVNGTFLSVTLKAKCGHILGIHLFFQLEEMVREQTAEWRHWSWVQGPWHGPCEFSRE